MDTFGTVKEYSELTGISKQSIHKNVRAGKIRKADDGRINFDEADQVYILSGRITKKTLPGEKLSVLPQKPKQKTAVSPAYLPDIANERLVIPGNEEQESEVGLDNLTAFQKMEALTVERTRKTKAEADIKELEFQELDGELVRVSEISDEVFKMNRTTRNRILAVPNRIVGLTHEQREEMKVELRTALEELSFE